MEAFSLDNEFLQYWSKLTVVEKQSLMNVAKNYVLLKNETGRISLEQYNGEIEEAMKRINAGEFYTQEQVIAMSKTRLDGQ